VTSLLRALAEAGVEHVVTGSAATNGSPVWVESVEDLLAT
jgi:hypothetical protein